MSEKGPKEIEQFAFEFGEHCTKFNNHIHFKEFIGGLVKDLAEDLDEKQKAILQEYVERLARAHSKEKEGLIKKYAKDQISDSSDESQEEEDNDPDADFM